MLFLQMQGQDMSWLDFNISNLMPNEDYSIKYMAYIAASSLWDPDSQAIFMSTNCIKRDLSSADPLNKTLALSVLPLIVTSELASNIVSDVAAAFNHSRPEVSQMAICSFYQICLKFPEALRAGFASLNVKAKLDDGDVGTQQAVLALLNELCMHNPKNFTNFVPTLYKLLTNAGSPWILVRTLGIFTMILSSLTPDIAQKLAQRLVQPVAEILETAASASVILEVIRLICDGPLKSPHLIQSAANRAQEFIKNPDPNLRYLGLTSMTRLMKIDAKVIACHGEIITSCLESDDPTCVVIAMDLISSIASRRNIGEYTLNLVEQIRSRQPGFVRDALVSRVIAMCSYNDYERVTDFEWYVNILFEIHGMGVVSSELAKQILTIGLRVESVRDVIVEEVIQIMEDPTGNDPDFIETAAFILGEYATDCSQHAFELLLSPKISNVAATAQAACIQNAFKLYAKTQDVEQFKNNGEFLLEHLKPYITSRYTEVQERASMFTALITLMQNETSCNFASFYAAPLKAVASTAQSQVKIPQSLDLSSPIISLEDNNDQTFDFIDEFSNDPQSPSGPDPSLFIIGKKQPKKASQGKPNIVVLNKNLGVEIQSQRKRYLLPKDNSSSSIELLPVEGEVKTTSAEKPKISALSNIDLISPLRPSEKLPEVGPYRQEEIMTKQHYLPSNRSEASNYSDYSLYFHQAAGTQGLSLSITDIKPKAGGLEIGLAITNTSPAPIYSLELTIDKSSPQSSQKEISPNETSKNRIFYRCPLLMEPKTIQITVLPTDGGAGEMLRGVLKIMPSFFLQPGKQQDFDSAFEKCEHKVKYPIGEGISIQSTIQKIISVIHGSMNKNPEKKIISLFSQTLTDNTVIAAIQRNDEGFYIEVCSDSQELAEQITKEIKFAFKSNQ